MSISPIKLSQGFSSSAKMVDMYSRGSRKTPTAFATFAVTSAASFCLSQYYNVKNVGLNKWAIFIPDIKNKKEALSFADNIKTESKTIQNIAMNILYENRQKLAKAKSDVQTAKSIAEFTHSKSPNLELYADDGITPIGKVFEYENHTVVEEYAKNGQKSRIITFSDNGDFEIREFDVENGDGGLKSVCSHHEKESFHLQYINVQPGKPRSSYETFNFDTNGKLLSYEVTGTPVERKMLFDDNGISGYVEGKILPDSARPTVQKYLSFKNGKPDGCIVQFKEVGCAPKTKKYKF